MVPKLQVSEQGKIAIHEARERQGWGWSVSRDDSCLVKASKFLNPEGDWQSDGPYAHGVSEGYWKSFLAGKPIRADVFNAFCKSLGLPWESVVDWNAIPSDAPFSLANELSNQKQDRSEFVRDVTVPDGSIFQIGEEFIKTWEIRNTGSVEWKSRWLRRIGACRGVGLIQSPEKARIPDTKPGQIVQVSVKLKAPVLETTTTAFWKMIHADGQLCFPDRYAYGVFVTIHVVRLQSGDCS
jgi:Ig-like domain from next to BRCA1 gene